MLSVLIGAVVIDIVFLILNFNNTIFVSKKLTEWYTLFGVPAMAMDILVITLATLFGLRIAQEIHKQPSLLQKLGWVAVVQVLHDILFACIFMSVPRGKSFILDFFKDYANEVGVHAIWSDTLMVLGTVLISEFLKSYKEDAKKITLMIAVYIGLFALYSKKPTAQF